MDQPPPVLYSSEDIYRRDNKEAADNGIELKGREPGLDYYLTEKNYWLPRKEVERKFAIYRVAELDTARKSNNAKAYALMTGIAAEVLAVFLVAAAVAFILLGRAGA